MPFPSDFKVEMGLGGNYSDEVVADSPYAYWKFDELTGSTAEDSISTRDGFPTVDVVKGAGGPLPYGGTSFTFDRDIVAGTWVYLGATYYLAGQVNYTIEAWIRTDYTAANNIAIYSERSVANDLLSLRYVPGTNTLILQIRDSAGTLNNLEYTSASTLKDGNWHHVAVTKSGTAVKFYIDGAHVQDRTQTGTDTYTDTPYGLFIGAEGINGFMWDGELAHVAIYRSALSGTRIAAHYTAGIWTEVTSDVLLSDGFSFRYGMASGGPTDRVADTGWFRFVLNNDTSNSGGLLGYYSPLHANVRDGFTYGVPVRVAFQYAGTWYYKWRGNLKEIAPEPGLKRRRITRCMAVDWMEQAATYKVREVDLQIGSSSDEVFIEVLSGIANQPAELSADSGADTYAYALDDIGRGEHPLATTVFHKLAMSEIGFIFVKGDTMQGGVLKFEDRHARPLMTANAVTFSNDMVAIEVPRTLERMFNRVEVTTHPKSIDAAATTVLFSLESTPSLSQGESITLWGDYRDPNQTLSLVGGTAMVTPVATTDYLFNSASNGSGTNLTTDLSVTATYFAATVKYVLTNTGASTGYITHLQARGKGLYDYGPELSVAEDTSLQATQGLRVLPVDMPYQENRNNGQGAAEYLLSLYSDAQEQVDSITFIANRSSTFLTAALSGEISTRLTLAETVTGVSSSGNSWFINAVEFDVRPVIGGVRIVCTWTLAPGNPVEAWILETAGRSELGSTTILGYL